MPRVLSYTPEWLMRPNPGYELFAPKTTAPKSALKEDDAGRRRTIATRNTEVFVAVGTEVRWADVAALKDGSGSCRTLKPSVPLPIIEIVISPNSDYLAISTSHTVHVAILPDSSSLEASSDAPIKLKTFQVGPTAHVREESPIASMLWHPLGFRGHTLVTITKEGVVRLWEVNRSDRSTFSEPTLSIDLSKLANATNDGEDLGASRYGASKGFSPDSFELEVASACFGDFPEQEGVHGWAPMTLWIAMLEGDIYALCPLLPSKWQLQDTDGASTVMQTLTTSINADVDNPEANPNDAEVVDRQLSWLSDLLYNEPLSEETPYGDTVKVFTRPESVPAIPLLQGPFSLGPSDVEDFEITDIATFSLKTFSFGADEGPAEGLPAAVICILTDTSQIHVCLDLLGVVGRWLPSAEAAESVSDAPAHSLTVVETIVLDGTDVPASNQSITLDTQTDYSFFVSNSKGVFYISLEAWIRKLENELAEPQPEGIEFRLDRLLEAVSSQAEHCLRREKRANAAQAPELVTACAAIQTGEVGNLILTAFGDEPQAVQLDAPETGLQSEEELAQSLGIIGLPTQMRPTYQPPKEFYEPLQFPRGIDQFIPHRHVASSKKEIRLSGASLDILMSAHKALSHDTHKLQTAVSDLFVRCERLRDEFHDQIVRTSQLVSRIESATGSDEAGDGSGVYGSAVIDERLHRVKTRQEQINARYEAIRRKMANIGGTDLSDRENAFMSELQALDRSLDKSAQTLTGDVDGSATPAWQRFDKIKGLQKDLTQQVDKVSKEMKDGRATGGFALKVPSHSRKQENEQIQELLQRETGLVEAAANRLRSLGISIPTEGGI